MTTGMKKGLILGIMLVVTLVAFADLIPRQDYTSDVSLAPIHRNLTFREASSQQLGWTFEQGTVAKDLTTATLVTFTYTPKSVAWVQVVTGALDVAANGSVLITFTPAQLNTNSTDGGLFDWILKVQDGTYTMAYAGGKLNLLKDFTGGVTNAFPTTSVPIDWSDYAAYLNTAGSGPVRGSTGLTVTTNADGSITFAVTDPTDNSFTNSVGVSGPYLSNTGDTNSGNNIIGLAVDALDTRYYTEAELIALLAAKLDTNDVGYLDMISNTSNWQTAYGWGDWGVDANFLAAITNITGAGSVVVSGSGRSRIITVTDTWLETNDVGYLDMLSNTSNWQTAYGWGDWSTRVGAIEGQTSNWNTAYGWGDWSTRVGAIELETNTWNSAATLAGTAIQKDGSVAWTADDNHGGSAMTNVTEVVGRSSYGVTVRSGTTDGADTANSALGMNNPSRGGYVRAYGNESGANPGCVYYALGNVAGSKHTFRDRGGVQVGVYDPDSFMWTFNNITGTNITALGTLDVAGLATFSGGVNAGGGTVTNAADPVNPQDLATRAYVLAQAGDGAAVGFIVNKDVTQAGIADVTETLVTYTNVLKDTDSGYDTATSCYTFPRVGLWHVGARVQWFNMGVNRDCRIILYHASGATTNLVGASRISSIRAGSSLYPQAADLIDVQTTNDFVFVQADHTNGNNDPALFATPFARFEGFYVGP